MSGLASQSADIAVAGLLPGKLFRVSVLPTDNNNVEASIAYTNNQVKSTSLSDTIRVSTNHWLVFEIRSIPEEETLYLACQFLEFVAGYSHHEDSRMWT